MFSIREKQIEALERMLNFNKSNNDGSSDKSELLQNNNNNDSTDPWKLLIYDTFCRDIISPLLRVGDLRKHGVTLHMLLESDRQPVADVPAIYFVMPTKENIKRICEDCKRDLYDNYHLNFASCIARPLLEDIANNLVDTEAVNNIASIYDQYLNFISLEKDFFSLNQQNSYVAFNDPSISDSQAQFNVQQTVDALFSVLVTLGVVPIIRCPKNGACEVIASQLDTKLHDHIFGSGASNTSTLFQDHISSPTLSFQRPVLIILDRNVDLSVMLQHTWTYQPLVHDLLNMNLNRVQVEVQELDDTQSSSTNSHSKNKEVKVYDLDITDQFWSQNLDTPFPNIAVAVNTYLKEYKSALDEFNKMSGGIDIDNYDQSELLGRTKNLGSFVNNIPILREKKRIIDVHTNIATALLNQIKSRELDSYFQMEESIIQKIPQDKKEFLNILQSDKFGTTDDKLRAFLIYYLSQSGNISSSDFENFKDTLIKLGADVSSVDFIRRTKALNDSLSSLGNLSGATSPSSSTSGSAVRGLLQKVNVGALNEAIPSSLTGYLGGGLSKQLGTLFTAGVKALLPSSKEVLVTRITDAVMELKNDAGLGIDNYCYFDPKVQKKMRQNALPRKNTPFKEAIVFVVGGGNYVELHNLQEYSKKQPAKKLIYGCTEVLNAKQFLQQLSELGKSSDKQ